MGNGWECQNGIGADLIDHLNASEDERCRLAAQQYDLAVELLRVRVAERIAAGVPQERWEAGVSSEIALALRISPHRAKALLARAVELHKNMAHARKRLRDGALSPEAIPLLVAGLSHLDPDLRRKADEELCADAGTLNGMGSHRIRDIVRRVAYSLDPRGTLARIASAAQDRRVTVRPLPDCMAQVSIVLPVAQAVGMYAALKRAADGIVGVGAEVRTRSQAMADLAHGLITGTESGGAQPVAINLTMSSEVLLGGKGGVAHLRDGGEIPAEIARALVGAAAKTGAAWVRRLYVTPESGAVVGMDSRSRLFPAALAEVIATRDRRCRTPYCDAPIAHIDHVVPHARGGATRFENGQGLCAACNYAKEAAGWSSTVISQTGEPHLVELRTPSGHTHRSAAPRIAS